MSRHGDGVDGFSERVLGGEVDEGHHHGKQRAVAVDVEPVARVAVGVENTQHAVEVVDGAFDGGADVDVDDGRTRTTGEHLVLEILIVHLPTVLGVDANGVHAIEPSCLEDGVMALLGGVQHTVWKHLPRQQDAFQVALGAACRHVAPVVATGDVPELGEEVENGELELSGVDTVVGGDEGVAQVVDGISQELEQLLVVVGEVVRIAKVKGCPCLQDLLELLQHPRFRVLRQRPFSRRKRTTRRPR
mmetsp:Transcript_38084/g.89032  ORF Transcript_38084/g.89032 Transcript_38084/m.89032 type:complete len:246 (-) Transcript_38084:626-1363(-)